MLKKGKKDREILSNVNLPPSPFFICASNRRSNKNTHGVISFIGSFEDVAIFRDFNLVMMGGGLNLPIIVRQKANF